MVHSRYSRYGLITAQRANTKDPCGGTNLLSDIKNALVQVWAALRYQKAPILTTKYNVDAA